MSYEWLLLLTWLTPLLLGLAQIIMPRRFIAVGAVAALPGLLAALLVPPGTLVEVPSLLLGAWFGLDTTGQIFLLFTALLWLAAGIFAAVYLQADAHRPRFFAFFLLAMAGNLGLIVSADMLSFYLWFAVMSFASYGLIVHTGTTDSREAGRIYMILVIVGEVLLFAALALIAATTGTLRLDELAALSIGSLEAALLFASFGIKAGVVVLHLWLPLAHPAAPIPASAVLSGAMIKAGLLGWLRFLYPAEGAPEWGALLIGFGLVTAFYGALVGVSQVNPKTVLAYSSISQMGFITVGVGAWVLLGAGDAGPAALLAVALYALHHALAKGALFLGVGFAGTSRLAPILLLLPALALTGLPLTSGAVAKAGLKSVTGGLPGDWPMLLDGLLPLAAAGTTLLMARFLWLMWQAPTASKTPPRALWASWLALLAAVVVTLFVWPAAGPAVTESLKPDKLWVAVWPILLGVGLAIIGGRLLRGLATPWFPPGDLLGLFSYAAGRLGRVVGYGIESAGRAERRIQAAVTSARGLTRAADFLTAWELRLRFDWLVAGGSLLLLTAIALVLIWAGT